MDTINKFISWIKIFGALALVVFLLTVVAERRPAREVTYDITFESPILVVTEIDVGYGNINIKGEMVNDTDEFIHRAYLQFRFYNNTGNYIGTVNQEHRFLNPNTTRLFNLDSNHRNVGHITITLVEE